MCACAGCDVIGKTIDIIDYVNGIGNCSREL